jgi:hypothetical protein
MRCPESWISIQASKKRERVRIVRTRAKTMVDPHMIAQMSIMGLRRAKSKGKRKERMSSRI